MCRVESPRAIARAHAKGYKDAGQAGAGE
jgi:hypothetical protein